MRLVLNGVIINPDHYNKKGTEVEISELQADGFRKATVQQEYTFTDDAFDIINTNIILNPDGKNAYLPVQIYEDNCCDTPILLFEGIVRGDAVKWCYGECSVEVSLIEQTEETLKINCLQSTIISDNWNGFQEANHPRVKYCVELRPDVVAYMILILGSILNIVFLLFYPIAFIILVIIEAINLIIGVFGGNEIDFDGNQQTNFIQEFEGWIDELNQRIVSCGRVHPSPFVRDYIQNVCDKCGVDFSSTIYNSSTSDYYNAMLFNAPVKKGTYNDNTKFIIENQLIDTLDSFLTKLKTVHNADFDVIDGILYFERKDFFYNGEIFVSYLSLDGVQRIKDKLCFNFRDEERPAYGSFEYSKDAMDVCGNEAIFRYNNKVEWNLPYSPLQSGHKDVYLPFSTPRFRNDGIDPDILQQFQGEGLYGQTIQAHQGVLILANHLSFTPKLLIWDGVDLDFARVKKYDVAGFDVPANENYNYPYLFTEFNSEPNTAYPSNQPGTGLYPRFYSIDNPKLIIDEGQEFSFSFYYDCETLSTAKDAQFVQLPNGVGRIKKISVNLDEKYITIQGDV